MSPVMSNMPYIIPRPILDLCDAHCAFVNDSYSYLGRAVGIIEQVALAALGALALQGIAAAYSAKIAFLAYAIGTITLSVPAGITIIGGGLIYIAAKMTAAWTVSSALIAIPAYIVGVFVLDEYNMRHINAPTSYFGRGIVDQLLFSGRNRW